MISADEIFMDQREAQFNINDEVHHRHLLEEERLPVIDMNHLEPQKSGQLMDLGGEYPELVDSTALELGNQIVAAITEGHINPLDFIVKKKLLEHAVAVAFRNPEVKAMALTEMAKYGKGEVRVLGAKLGIYRRTKYNYQEDATWNELTESIAETREKIKAQEERVKTATKNGAALVDPDSGALLAQPVTDSTSESITVSFKKK